MHTLYLLRHAKSSWSDPTVADQERALARRGRRDAKRIAEYLVQLGIEPELVLCSTAERARQTLERVRAALGATSTVRLEAVLYAASAEALLKRIRLVPEEVASLMLIGHNPGLQDLALALASAGPEVARLKAKFNGRASRPSPFRRQPEPTVHGRRGAAAYVVQAACLTTGPVRCQGRVASPDAPSSASVRPPMTRPQT
jgi:phosphohistidine phosphatase